RIAHLAFSPDGQRFLAVVSVKEREKQRDEVKVWDATGRESLAISGGRSRLTLDGLSGPTALGMAFSSDGKLLAVAVSTGSLPGPPDTAFASSAEVKVYDAGTGRERLVLKGHSNSGARLVLFSPDGRRIVTSGGYVQDTGQAHDEVKMWDAGRC